MFYCTYNTQSIIGTLKLVAETNHLIAIEWGHQEINLYLSAIKVNPKDHSILLKTILQLMDYFSGNKITFKVPLMTKGTEFQKKVWQALLNIPYGKTVSYQYIANAIG